MPIFDRGRSFKGVPATCSDLGAASLVIELDIMTVLNIGVGANIPIMK
jgi:hypothetical protein